MILQALNRYYERKAASGELAPDGFERKEIPFVIVVDDKGHLVQIDDTRTVEGKNKRARSFLVPLGVKKSVNIDANLLWGNLEYLLGIPDAKKLEEKKKGGKERDYRDRLVSMQNAFVGVIRSRLHSVLDDAGVAAVLAFLEAPDMDRWASDARWIDVGSANLAFRLATDREDMLVSSRPSVVNALRRPAEADATALNGTRSICLVSGDDADIARLHPAIKGVWDAQTSGANIVSFNRAAFNSYAKEQNFNAPVGEQAAFNYTTALNHLLRKDSPQRIQIGDASTAFWSAEDSPFEDSFAALFGAVEKDDPDRGVRAVRNLLTAMQTGVYLGADAQARFHVLGLAPNAARIAVRFWHSGPVRDFAQNIGQHFQDIAIDKPAYESSYLSLPKLLNSIALLNKAENVPPDLAGDTMRAILTGLPYPAMLLQAAIRRGRAEREISFARAAIIKASLNRFIRAGQFNAKELTVSLDKTNPDPGYRLGRLFATLERIQLAAQPGINATIRDRYYGAAGSSPASVFPVLLRLKNHHLGKLDNAGLVVWYERLLGEVIGGIATFPAQLSLLQQGQFAIGYYHQQQDFFAGKAKTDTDADSTRPSGEQ